MQIQKLKTGTVKLTLHRELGPRPEGISDLEWADWVRAQPKYWSINKAPIWWDKVWPRIKGEVNIALAKGHTEVVLKDIGTWIRIGDDISISIYGIDRDQHGGHKGPFHPGCLTDHMRCSIDWWSDKIEDITEKVGLIAFGVRSGAYV